MARLASCSGWLGNIHEDKATNMKSDKMRLIHGIWVAGLLRGHGARTTLERSNTASSSKKDLDLTVNVYMSTK